MHFKEKYWTIFYLALLRYIFCHLCLSVGAGEEEGKRRQKTGFSADKAAWLDWVGAAALSSFSFSFFCHRGFFLSFPFLSLSLSLSSHLSFFLFLPEPSEERSVSSRLQLLHLLPLERDPRRHRHHRHQQHIQVNLCKLVLHLWHCLAINGAPVFGIFLC